MKRNEGEITDLACASCPFFPGRRWQISLV